MLFPDSSNSTSLRCQHRLTSHTHPARVNDTITQTPKEKPRVPPTPATSIRTAATPTILESVLSSRLLHLQPKFKISAHLDR